MFKGFTIIKGVEDIMCFTNLLMQELSSYFLLKMTNGAVIPKCIERINILKYESFIYKQKDGFLIYIDNTIEGNYHSLIKNISLSNQLEAMLCIISHDKIYPGYRMCSFLNGNERIVYAIKEQKWTFYEEGKIRWFENSEYYSALRVTQRFNYNILKSYLEKQNMTIDDESFWTPISDVTMLSRR